MFKKIWIQISAYKDKFPIVYSIILITLIPLTLVFNTWWNVRAFNRDSNFAVREQALAVQKTLATFLVQNDLESSWLQTTLENIRKTQTSITRISILKYTDNGEFLVLSSAGLGQNSVDEQLFLNQMAWTGKETFFTQSYDVENGRNVWIAVGPVLDDQGKAKALINLKISTETVDQIINRTTRDSVIVLVISVGVIILLLLNHLRFFERSMLVDKLKEIDKMKDDFISVASHELRTPLTAIKSGVSMIKEDFQQNIPSQIQEWFGIIDQSVARLNDLVNDLLNVSRLEQNRLDFVLTPVNADEMLKEIVSQLQFSAIEKKLQLNLELGNDTSLINVQADRLREVFTNLIGNAIKYTKQGKVTVSKIVEKSTVRYLVQDTGIGLAPEDKEKLFMKFSRIANDQTKDIPGTGLGLWITKTIVEKMKGKIFVDSILGQGTVFTVVFEKAAKN